MSVPVRITFRHLKTRPDIEAEILTHVAHLEQFYDRIVDCRVLIEQPHRRRDSSNLYRVVIELTVPQDRLVITHDPALPARVRELDESRVRKSVEADPTHKHVHDTLYEAFRIAGRQLQDYAGRHRDAVRHA